MAQQVLDSLIEPWDVAWMQTLLKASRSTVSPHKRDHYTDAIGYSACGWDCAQEDTNVDSATCNHQWTHFNVMNDICVRCHAYTPRF
jgi:hypothetical protein